MISTVLLGCSAALLSVAAIILGTYALRLRRENKSKRLSLGSVFLALGFLPMALVMFADLKRGSLPIFSYLTYFRNPFFMTDLTFDLFAQIGEISFLMDFITAILLSSTVVITLSRHSAFRGREEEGGVRKPTCKSKPVAERSERRAIARPYLCYGCYLS